MRRTKMFHSRGVRRATQWYGATLGVGDSLLTNNYKAYLLTNPFTGLAGSPTLIDPTLVRIRGALAVMQETVGQRTVGAAGILKTTLPPSGSLSSGTIPDPYSFPEVDWIWHSYFNAPSVSGVLWNWAFQTPGLALDSKSKRKMGDRDVLVFVITNSSSSTETIDYTMGCRMLFQGQRR